MDPVADWDLSITFDDYVSHQLDDLTLQCAQFVADLPGVHDVTFEDRELIAVYGTISEPALRESVWTWWLEKLRERRTLPG